MEKFSEHKFFPTRILRTIHPKHTQTHTQTKKKKTCSSQNQFHKENEIHKNYIALKHIYKLT